MKKPSNKTMERIQKGQNELRVTCSNGILCITMSGLEVQKFLTSHAELRPGKTLSQFSRELLKAGIVAMQKPKTTFAKLLRPGLREFAMKEYKTALPKYAKKLSKKEMKQSKETIAEWIRMVNEEASKPLTIRELGFMESITDQFERNGSVSDKQEEILER